MPDDVVHILGKCAAEIEQHIHQMEQQVQRLLVNPATQHLAQLHNLLDMVVNARVSRDNLSSLRLIRKVQADSFCLINKNIFVLFLYEILTNKLNLNNRNQLDFHFRQMLCLGVN